MWNKVTKEHLFIFLVILTAFILFNYFEFNFSSLVTYYDKTCLNEGYSCCVEGNVHYSIYDSTCSKGSKCFDVCSKSENVVIWSRITGLGFFDFFKNLFEKEDVTGKVVDYNPDLGQITNNDLSITILRHVGKGNVSLVFDATNDIINNNPVCEVQWGDGSSDFDIGYYMIPYSSMHTYSSSGTKTVTVSCTAHVYNPSDDMDIPYPASKSSNVIIPSLTTDTTPPYVSVYLSDNYNAYSNVNDGIIHAVLANSDSDSYVKSCLINLDNTNWVDVNPPTSYKTFGSIVDPLNDGTHSVYYKCSNRDDYWSTASNSFSVNKGGGILTENYFRDGLDGIEKTCGAPDSKCSGTTKDNFTDKTQCSTTSNCVFKGNCYTILSLMDISSALINDYDSSSDKEVCVSYWMSGARDVAVGTWIDADIGDSDSNLKPYCETFWKNNAGEKARWISNASKVKCERANRWGSNNYCDDTKQGKDFGGLDGVDFNYCCGDDPKEFYITTGGKSACCDSPSDKVDGKGDCIEGSNIEVKSLGFSKETLDIEEPYHYTNVEFLCNVSSADGTKDEIKSCVGMKIENKECNNVSSWYKDKFLKFTCNVDGEGKKTANCYVGDKCRSTSRSVNLTFNVIKPENLCEDIIEDGISISNVEYDEKVNTGSDTAIEVEVERENTRNDFDLFIDLYLYDLTSLNLGQTGLVFEDVIQGTIKSGDKSEKFISELNIPRKSFMFENDVYRLYTKVYTESNGEEENICLEGSYPIKVELKGGVSNITTIRNVTVESCNGLDDDNDGFIDEALNKSCGVGVCEGGIQACSNGKWQECSTNYLASDEICDDNEDNDCDDYIDAEDSDCSKIVDSDRDSLPDEWEMKYFGSLKISDGSGDYDKDGLSDYEEYIEKFDPTKVNVVEEPKSKLWIITLVILILLVIGAIVYLLFWKVKLKKPNIKFTFSSFSRKARNMDSMYNYVKMALRKGYSKQQIKRILLNKGWKEKEVDDAFKKTS